MRRSFVLFTGFILAGFSSPAQKAAAQKQVDSFEGYRLVWSDEFNTDGPPDPKSWGYENGYVRNEEAQWYQRENAFCENGLLVIEGRKEQRPNPLYEEGSSDWRKKNKMMAYTSSSINTRGLHDWQYGRFVMRGRIDISQGLWPAWWTLGVKGRWPANGEIDILEFYKNTLLANVACLGNDDKPLWFVTKWKVDSLGGEKWASGFHVWQMDWDENAISLYVDDNLMNKVELSNVASKEGLAQWPFRQPHYMLLNLAMGGHGGGEIPPSTKFPNRFEVDYVRVYQKE